MNPTLIALFNGFVIVTSSYFEFIPQHHRGWHDYPSTSLYVRKLDYTHHVNFSV